MAPIVEDLATGFLDLVFAPVCAACGEPISTRSRGRLVCNLCWNRCRPLPEPRCRRCWTPLQFNGAESVTCPLCPELRPAVLGLRSAYLLEGPPREMVHGLKYRAWHGLAREMALRMAEMALPEASEGDIDVVVPVPMSASRLRQRGYNQAALLAREVARLKGLPAGENALARTPGSGSQTTLHPDQRRANVAGAFRAAEKNCGVVLAAHVLLVDDIWTTGATTRACADALLGGGARAVTIATFARSLPHMERLTRRLERMTRQKIT